MSEIQENKTPEPKVPISGDQPQIFTRQILASSILLVLVIAFLGYWLYFRLPHPGSPVVISQKPQLEERTFEDHKAGPVTVYVCGEVNNPGIYTLPAGARIAGALEAAGGATKNADLERINLASKLKDEQMVRIPHRDGADLPGTSPAPLPSYEDLSPRNLEISSSPAGRDLINPILGTSRVNLNSASSEELQKLPGIGKKMAQRILEYRRAFGPFTSPEDLKKVPGIGKGVYEKVKDLIEI